MGLKRQTKRHQNNTPICFAHLDKCNGIVLGPCLLEVPSLSAYSYTATYSVYHLMWDCPGIGCPRQKLPLP